MGARRAFSEHSVGVFGDIFDLHARHGAILALVAPEYKSARSVAFTSVTYVPGAGDAGFARLVATTNV